MRRMLLMHWTFLVVAEESRTSFRFPHLANEQVYKSWEGAQPGRLIQAGQQKYSTPQTSCSVYKCQLVGGRDP